MAPDNQLCYWLSVHAVNFMERFTQELPKRPDTWPPAAGPPPWTGTPEAAPLLPAAQTRTLAPQAPPAANGSAHSVRVVLVAVGVAVAVLLLPACLLLAHMHVRSRAAARQRQVRVATRAAADISGTAEPVRAASVLRQGTGEPAGSSRRDPAELDTGKAQAAGQVQALKLFTLISAGLARYAIWARSTGIRIACHADACRRASSHCRLVFDTAPQPSLRFPYGQL